jgi:pimeloyl-ACP methyl ester carboxylesterase
MMQKKNKQLSYESSLDFIDHNNLQKLKTDFGNLAFLDKGSGTPILFFHGVIGGLETVFNFYDSSDLNQYRLISISRPGYRFSDDFNANINDITKYYLDLLDRLEIDKVHVNAWSAGCFFARYFVKEHPERVLSTVMINPILPGYRRWFSLLSVVLVNKLMYESFELMSKKLPKGYILLFSVITGADYKTIIENKQLNDKVMGFLEVAKPLDSWLFGTKNEMKMIRGSIGLDNNELKNTKFLVSHTDRIGGYKKNMKRYNIQHEAYEFFEKGGHFMAILYKDNIDKTIRDFIRQQT